MKVSEDRFLVTPWFLDQFSPELAALPPLSEQWEIHQPGLPAGSTQQRMLPLMEAIASFTACAIQDGARPISLAGDCCTAIAVLAGLRKGLTGRTAGEPVLIWLDAHGDFNTWETTPSGFLGGMPLAMLVGRGEQTFLEGLKMPPFPEDHVLFTDGRDLDPPERAALLASQVHWLTDPLSLLQHPLVTSGESPILVHFDTDITNPLDAPAQGYLAPGGPRAEDVRRLFAGLAATGKIAAISLSAWRPHLDAEKQTQKVCLSLLQTLRGG